MTVRETPPLLDEGAVTECQTSDSDDDPGATVFFKHDSRRIMFLLSHCENGRRQLSTRNEMGNATGMYNAIRDEIDNDVITPEEMKTFKTKLKNRTWSHMSLSEAETNKFYKMGYHKKLLTLIKKKQSASKTKRSTRRSKKTKRRRRTKRF